MNKILLLATVLIYCCPCHAQSVSLSVLNATGKTATAKNVELSWSVGEMAIATLKTAQSIVTEGFLQPDITSNSGIEGITINNMISCFPNPVHNMLYIMQKSDIIGAVSIYNALGDRVYDQKFSDGIIDMTFFKPGFYFINITELDGKEVHVFKIIKY